MLQIFSSISSPKESKYGWVKHLPADHHYFGSIARQWESRSSISGVISGSIFSKVLPSLIQGTLTPLKRGFVIKANFCFEVSIGPRRSMIRLKVSKSLSPGNSGIPLKISVNMHPKDQMSTPSSYAASPTNNSGLQYHLVLT